MTDKYEGQGGSYIKDKDGKRSLVERTGVTVDKAPSNTPSKGSKKNAKADT